MYFGQSPVVELLRLGVGALVLLAELVGVIVCCRNLQLSVWVKSIALGLVLLLLAGLWSWGGLLLMRFLDVGLSVSPELLFLLGSLAHGAGWMLLVLGLAATFADVRQRLGRYRIEIHRLSGDQPPPR
jgi:hypothetical protein